MFNQSDVLVIGGGPAGASAAIASARAGLRVALLERSNYERIPFGETLPPEARIQLEKLDVWDDFQQAGHIVSPGSVSVWGSDIPSANDFIFNPYGCGWHVDRRRFDEMLVQKSKVLGVDVRSSMKVVSVVREEARRWRVNAVAGGKRCEFVTRYLIDASGKSCVIANRLGIRKSVYDRLVAAICFLRLKADSDNCDSRTLVEATELGWWYSALLPNSKLAIAFITDANLFQRDVSLALQCQKQLENAPLTAARVASCFSEFDFRLVSAASYALQNVAGEGWVCAGEAAMRFDPLSSSGIICALESGIRAGQLALESVRSEKVTNKAYDSWVRDTVANFLLNRKRYYQMETRWPYSSFWQKQMETTSVS